MAKVYLHFDPDGRDFTIKYAVDSDTTVADALNYCAAQINTKYPNLISSSLELRIRRAGSASDLTPTQRILSAVGDDDDMLEVVKVSAPPTHTPILRTCTRNGCGKKYTDADNSPEACFYHPKAPIFHEGLKGWSCCSKRVVGFDEIFTIPGCTATNHTSEEPEARLEPVRTTPAAPSSAVQLDTSGTTEVYRSSKEPPPKTTPAPGPSSSPLTFLGSDFHLKEPPKPIEIENDPEDAVIQPGTNCKRNGCKVTHRGSSTPQPCVHHPGVPVFHEGTKFWSCCSKNRQAEFEMFLRIEGCAEGKHKFLPFKKDLFAANQLTLRHDWYSTGGDVVVNFYSKTLDKAKSAIVFGPRTLKVELMDRDDKRFTKEFALAAETVPEASSFEFLSTKLEIKLRKKEPVAWDKLEKVV